MSSITSAQAAVVSAYSSQNSPVATLASTPPVDSIILAAIYANENSGQVDITTPPAGYTEIVQDEIANAIKVALYYRTATAGESTSVQAFFNRNCPCAIIAANYQGGDPANWLDVFASTRGAGTTVQSGSIATHATAKERWFSVLGAQYDNGSFTSPTNGFTALVNSGKTASGGASESFTYGLFTKDNTVGTTGPATMSAGVSPSRNWAGIVVALQERVPVTYVKTGIFVADSKISGSKSRSMNKTGSLKANQSKLLGARTTTFNRKGTLISALALAGLRPAFYTKSGIFKVDGLILTTGPTVHIRGATIIRDPSDYIYGTASGKISTTGSGPYQGGFISFTPDVTDQHTISIFVKSFDPLRLRVANSSGVTLETSPTIAPTINWTRVIFTTTGQLIAHQVYRLYIETTQAVATSWWVDGVQAEEGLVASPFTVGSKPSGGGPVGRVLREQKPAGLVMDYEVAPGSPNIFATYQELYDHHPDYEDVMNTEQTYKQVFLTP